jgi:hypothetical protein
MPVRQMGDLALGTRVYVNSLPYTVLSDCNRDISPSLSVSLSLSRAQPIYLMLLPDSTHSIGRFKSNHA